MSLKDTLKLTDANSVHSRVLRVDSTQIVRTVLSVNTLIFQTQTQQCCPAYILEENLNWNMLYILSA
jgi:hypothetical protein